MAITRTPYVVPEAKSLCSAQAQTDLWSEIYGVTFPKSLCNGVKKEEVFEKPDPRMMKPV